MSHPTYSPELTKVANNYFNSLNVYSGWLNHQFEPVLHTNRKWALLQWDNTRIKQTGINSRSLRESNWCHTQHIVQNSLSRIITCSNPWLTSSTDNISITNRKWKLQGFFHLESQELLSSSIWDQRMAERCKMMASTLNARLHLL